MIGNLFVALMAGDTDLVAGTDSEQLGGMLL